MNVLAFPKQLVQEIGKDKVGQLSAAFSYGAIFSIGPLLLVLISVIGFIYGQEAAQGKLLSELSGTFGATTAKTIQDVVAHTHQSGGSALALILGIVGMLLGAAGITTQLQNSFNTIFSIVPDPDGGIKQTILVKLKNVLLVLTGGVLVAASLVASTIIISLGTSIQENLGLPPVALELLNNAISLATFIGVLFLLYKAVPDVVLPSKVVIVTAFYVSLLFIVGKIALSFIIGRNGAASAYGAAASLVSLLLWIYYSSQIIFIGAEGMKIYGYNRSLEYKPKRNNLHRTTLHVDSNDFRGRLVEAWARGFKKGSSKK